MPISGIHLCQCLNCQQPDAHPDKVHHQQMNLLLSRLDEQQRRWYVALEANHVGHGGVRWLSHITGLDEKTIQRGQQELAQELLERPPDQIRLAGGGRLRVEKKNPALEAALQALVLPETAGDPMSEQKWVRSSLQHLSDQLKSIGHLACPKTIGRLLKKLDYSLKANVKRLAGTQHPDRNTQFEYLDAQRQLFLHMGWPMVSLDGKKKELIGNFKNAGQTWCREAELVNDHDFESAALGKAVPYGIYDVTHNRGAVYVGQSADTAEFAVDMLSRWWQTVGRDTFPTAPCLLVLCDGGGSNGYRSRLWKAQLQEKLADALGLTIIVCHYPTGTSKWNPIEHRLFGPISLNWAAKPLRTFDTLLACIRGTTTKTGLQVSATLIEQTYARGIKVTDEIMGSLNLIRHAICPNWNYTIHPRTAAVGT